MRLAASPLLTRRAAHVLAALLTTAPLRRPAHALVDGIPLCKSLATTRVIGCGVTQRTIESCALPDAPGDKINLPEVGFEVQLPLLEGYRDRTLPALRGALERADWEGAAKEIGVEAVTQQLKVLGDTASILGDEAYTALSVKSRYAATVKKVQAAVVAGRQEEALREVGNLDATLREYIGLVPSSVVDLVRKREQRLAGLQTAAAPSSTASQPTAPAPAAPAGGLLMSPSGPAKVCGVDIRC